MFGNSSPCENLSMADDLREVLEGIRLELERNRLEFDRNRAFNREMLARYDQLARDTERRWIEESQRSQAVHSAVIERMNELGQEIRAQTRAIFRMLDWLDSGDGPRPAGP